MPRAGTRSASWPSRRRTRRCRTRCGGATGTRGTPPVRSARAIPPPGRAPATRRRLRARGRRRRRRPGDGVRPGKRPERPGHPARARAAEPRTTRQRRGRATPRGARPIAIRVRGPTRGRRAGCRGGRRVAPRPRVGRPDAGDPQTGRTPGRTRSARPAARRPKAPDPPRRRDAVRRRGARAGSRRTLPLPRREPPRAGTRPTTPTSSRSTHARAAPRGRTRHVPTSVGARPTTGGRDPRRRPGPVPRYRPGRKVAARTAASPLAHGLPALPGPGGRRVRRRQGHRRPPRLDRLDLSAPLARPPPRPNHRGHRAGSPGPPARGTPGAPLRRRAALARSCDDRVQGRAAVPGSRGRASASACSIRSRPRSPSSSGWPG